MYSILYDSSGNSLEDKEFTGNESKDYTNILTFPILPLDRTHMAK